MRDINNSDIWAAIRGLNMYSLELTAAELDSLIARHSAINTFASQVIAEAARQVKTSRNNR